MRLEVFHPVAEGYRGSEFQDRYFNSGCWQHLTLDLPRRQREIALADFGSIPSPVRL